MIGLIGEKKRYRGRCGPPDGKLSKKKVTSMRWHSDGSEERGGWAICQQGALGDLAEQERSLNVNAQLPGPSQPWYRLSLATSLSTVVSVAALLGSMGAVAVLSAGAGGATSPTARHGCEFGLVSVLVGTGRTLCGLAAATYAAAACGLAVLQYVGCSAAPTLCPPMLPLFWCGMLSCAAGAMGAALLAVARPPRPLNPAEAAASADDTEATERRLAVVVGWLAVCCGGFGVTCLTMTAVSAEEQHSAPSPLCYVFSGMMLLLPLATLPAVWLARRARRKRRRTSDGALAAAVVATQAALGMLALSTLLAATIAVGLPAAVVSAYHKSATEFVVYAVAALTALALALACGALVVVLVGAAAAEADGLGIVGESEREMTSMLRMAPEEEEEVDLEAVMAQQRRLLDLLDAKLDAKAQAKAAGASGTLQATERRDNGGEGDGRAAEVVAADESHA